MSLRSDGASRSKTEKVKRPPWLSCAPSPAPGPLSRRHLLSPARASLRGSETRPGQGWQGHPQNVQVLTHLLPRCHTRSGTATSSSYLHFPDCRDAPPATNHEPNSETLRFDQPRTGQRSRRALNFHLFRVLLRARHCAAMAPSRDRCGNNGPRPAHGGQGRSGTERFTV